MPTGVFPRIPPEDRFWSKVEKTDKCWEWQGGKFNNGYGAIRVNGKNIMAHRFSYELFNGNIPKDLQIDHLCRNRSCVNPDHLEVVTRKENICRGLTGLNNHFFQKTHCPRGHEYTPKNIYHTSQGGRACLVCQKEYNRNYRRKMWIRKTIF